MEIELFLLALNELLDAALASHTATSLELL
jgi:hypothetical protein